MKILNLVSVLLVFFAVSCSTKTNFKVPEKATLYVDGNLVTEQQYTEYKRSPFFWNTTGGVPYRIMQDGKVIDQGKLQTHFRVVSIFWPPFALIYWPMGFRKEGYDFTSKWDTRVRPEPNFVEAPHRK